MNTNNIRGGKGREEMDEKVGVRIMTLEWCDTCTWLKSELDAAGIFYYDIDAEANTEFADSIEDKFKTNKYPIVFLTLPDRVITILSETDLETSPLIRIFDSVPQLVSTIKQIKNEI